MDPDPPPEEENLAPKKVKNKRLYGPITPEEAFIQNRKEAGVCKYGPLDPCQAEKLQKHYDETAFAQEAADDQEELEATKDTLVRNSGFTRQQRKTFREAVAHMSTNDAVLAFHHTFNGTDPVTEKGTIITTTSEKGGKKADTQTPNVPALFSALCTQEETGTRHWMTTVFLFILAVVHVLSCFLVDEVTKSMWINIALPLVACVALRISGSSSWRLPCGGDIGMLTNKYCALCISGSMAGALILASLFGGDEYTPYVQKVGSEYKGVADSCSAAINASGEYAAILSVGTGVAVFIPVAAIAVCLNNRSMKSWLYNKDSDSAKDTRTSELFKESKSTGKPDYAGRWSPQVLCMLVCCMLLGTVFVNLGVDVQQPRFIRLFLDDTTPNKGKATKVLGARTGQVMGSLQGAKKGSFAYAKEMHRVCPADFGFTGYVMAEQNDEACGTLPMRWGSTKDDWILAMTRSFLVGPRKPLITDRNNTAAWNIKKPREITNKNRVLGKIDETDVKNQSVRFTRQMHLISPMITALIVLISLWRLVRPVLPGEIPIEEADTPANAIVDVLTVISVLVIAMNMVGPLVPTAYTALQKCIVFGVSFALFLICQCLWAARDLVIKMLIATFGRNNRVAASLTRFLLTVTVNGIFALILVVLAYYVYVTMDGFVLTNDKLDGMIPSWFSTELKFSIKGFFLDNVVYMPVPAPESAPESAPASAPAPTPQ